MAAPTTPSTTPRPLAQHLVLLMAFVAITFGVAITALVILISIGPCGREPDSVLYVAALKGSLALVGVGWTLLPAFMARSSWRDVARRWPAAPWAVLAVLTTITTVVIVAKAQVDPLCM